MRPGKETRSQRVSGRAISYDIKSGAEVFQGRILQQTGSYAKPVFRVINWGIILVYSQFS